MLENEFLPLSPKKKKKIKSKDVKILPQNTF